MVARAKAVEDLQLGRGQRQLAMLVLSVEGEQRTADLAQIGDGGRAPAEVSTGAPVGAHPAGERELLRFGADALAELLAQTLGQVEDPLDVCLTGPRTNDSWACPPTQEQVERMRQHRLARAGLTREHVQPGRQAQLRLLDQQEVLDAKLLQHLMWSTSARGRITRTQTPATL